MVIRNVQKQDIPGIKAVIDSTELFPSEMLDDMIKGYLENPKDSSNIWMTEVKQDDGDKAEVPISIVYAVPEKMTAGTYNALLLAVSSDAQGQGHGSKCMQSLEKELKEKRDARILLVETSGTDDFARTRAFYEKIGFEKEARIRDFYEAGDDKIVYRKDLTKK
eukprot:CAMPEP_0198121498 /NCGR_PEP_ID=MMETSP1442-20131203/32322_1 /TAXON_ID= /ORGANISM="Craspedostauros australis, Strain CCMP3328" /LENGTH=163 /DNA_ID=CAMNT_0043780315 /DNA_START=195 /DNA_END=686 /DNA_ORIENTATION=-